VLKTLRSWILGRIRRALGTAQVLEQQQLFDARQEQRHFRQTQMMLALGNAITYSTLSADRLRALPVYQRCAQIIGPLSPMDVDGGVLVRIGRHHDGGYVMLEGFSRDTVDAAYSFGVGRDASWDTAIADRGIEVFLFDHTIDRLPVSHAKCHHVRTGVTGFKQDERRRTLSALIADRGHAGSRRLIMKMDVEGAEWDVFDEASPDAIAQFSQLVIEFHRLTAAAHEERRLARILRVLGKLNQTHQCVHVHANTNVPRPPIWIGPLVLPDALEATFIRRDEVPGRLRPTRRQFPDAIDEPSNPSSPGLHLGRFTADAPDHL
jgi:hypothetical protein